MPSTFEQHARPVIFGELLFDHYPDGNKVLAGAPLAVAWHCQGFGLRPLLITRIGQDIEGEIALTAMHQWGLDTRAVQIDSHHTTGNVVVSSENKDNHFEIKSDQAWDYISSSLALEWLKDLPCSLLYVGSLAQRHSVSYKTLQQLVKEIKLPLFVDINLRPPWVDNDVIEQNLKAARWLKLNDSELALLLHKDVEEHKELLKHAEIIRAQYEIELLYVTCGEKGAFIVREAEVTESINTQTIKSIDTVGAGDAFTSVCILGFYKDWNQQQTLTRANEFAAKVCQIQGATSLLKSDYDYFLKKWS